MSPRAAWRLEELGFKRVYDFVGGKLEWRVEGLPTEGTGPFYLVVGKNIRPPTATCSPDSLAWEIRREMEPGPDSICAVTNAEGIVLGRVRWKDLPAEDGFDGASNLRDAVAAAVAPELRDAGVVVTLAGTLEPADDVTKLHTTAFTAFGSRTPTATSISCGSRSMCMRATSSPLTSTDSAMR